MINRWKKDFDRCDSIKKARALVKRMILDIKDSSVDLKTKRQEINEFVEYIDRKLYAEISNQILNYSETYFLLEKDSIKLVIAMYLTRNRNPLTVKEYFSLLSVLIKLFEAYSDNSGQSISAAEIRELFSTEKGRITLDYIQRNRRVLTIIKLPAYHRDYNSLFVPAFNCILTSVLDTKKYNKKYVFLHEVGHAVHFANAESTINSLPEGAIELMEKVFKLNREEIRQEDRAEIFADFFSVYYMRDTRHEKDNPFIERLGPGQLGLICDYFDKFLAN